MSDAPEKQPPPMWTELSYVRLPFPMNAKQVLAFSLTLNLSAAVGAMLGWLVALYAYPSPTLDRIAPLIIGLVVGGAVGHKLGARAARSARRD